MDCKSFKSNLDGNISSSTQQQQQSGTTNKIIINLAKPPKPQALPSIAIQINSNIHETINFNKLASTNTDFQQNSHIATTSNAPIDFNLEETPKEILDNILRNIEIQDKDNWQEERRATKKSKLFDEQKQHDSCNNVNINKDKMKLFASRPTEMPITRFKNSDNNNDNQTICYTNELLQPQQQQSLPETSCEKTIIMNTHNIQPILEVEIDSSSSPPSTSSTLSSSISSSFLSLGSQDKIHRQGSSKKNVLFDTVTVYHFNRSQGFSSIPSQGGSTLGMKKRHFLRRKLSVDMFEEVRRRSRREILLKIKFDKDRLRAMARSSNIVEDEDINSNDKNDDNKNIINTNINDNTDNNHEINVNDRDEQIHTKSLSSTTSSRSTNMSNSNSDDESFSDYSDISDSELESDSYVFLQPIGVKLRRSLLRASGVGKIDPTEKLDCKIIRESRERSGCKCVNQCIPGLCECTLLGVNCHVDRVSFPCGCVEAGCRNPMGRTEFDVKRVKGHLYDTLFKVGVD